jgi:DNA-binding NarL/FixJ family response regulator
MLLAVMEKTVKTRLYQIQKELNVDNRQDTALRTRATGQPG